MENNNSYREIPFTPETQYNDFYIYIDLTEIPEKNENHCEQLKCRTLGILQSINGRFYLSDLNTCGSDPEPLVQVSVVYLPSPPQSTVIPYPVQIFGTLQWKNRPVIFAKILQVMNPATAIRLKKALSGITTKHLAVHRPLEDEEQGDSVYYNKIIETDMI